METTEFLKAISELRITHVERAMALLWFHSVTNNDSALSPKEICQRIEQVGFAKQNPTRIRQAFIKDRRVVKSGKEAFRINPKSFAKLEELYSIYLECRPIPKTSPVLSVSLFQNAKGYIRKVVEQLNASYHYSLFDCCAVMCRRLIETLIIEAYEHHSIDSQIKDGAGNYLTFSGLIARIEADNSLSLSRNTNMGLKHFKKLGDLSAHNRRFNARKPDIDQIRDDLRIASEELLHMCNQAA